MHTYSAFWIREEFHHHYFYRSDILYRFLHEYLRSDKRSNEWNDQYNYVTQFIPYSELLSHINNFHQRRINISISEESIELSKDDSFAIIYMAERCFTIKCESIEQLDSLLFQPLKTFNPSFFVIELGSTNSGWVTPIKKEILLR